MLYRYVLLHLHLSYFRFAPIYDLCLRLSSSWYTCSTCFVLLFVYSCCSTLVYLFAVAAGDRMKWNVKFLCVSAG